VVSHPRLSFYRKIPVEWSLGQSVYYICKMEEEVEMRRRFLKGVKVRGLKRRWSAFEDRERVWSRLFNRRRYFDLK
jgi:hypothetical protein